MFNIYNLLTPIKSWKLKNIWIPLEWPTFPSKKQKVGWTIVSFGLVGLIPNKRLRIWLNTKAFRVAFRIIARSISALIKVHNPEYKPKNCGFCVANHTSPIDVAILSTESTFSLVRRSTKTLGGLSCVGLAKPQFLCFWTILRRFCIQILNISTDDFFLHSRVFSHFF